MSETVELSCFGNLPWSSDLKKKVMESLGGGEVIVDTIRFGQSSALMKVCAFRGDQVIPLPQDCPLLRADSTLAPRKSELRESNVFLYLSRTAEPIDICCSRQLLQSKIRNP